MHAQFVGIGHLYIQNEGKTFFRFDTVGQCGKHSLSKRPLEGPSGARSLRRLLLIGEYDLTIDEKGRCQIPSDIRKAIVPDRDGEALYLVLGLNRRPWLYPENVYEDMVFKQGDDIAPGREQLDFAHANFALAHKINMDAQGRALILEKTLKRTGVGREITLIGAGNHLEIWPREEWAKRRDEDLLPRIEEVAIKAKQSWQSPSNNGTTPPAGANGNG